MKDLQKKFLTVAPSPYSIPSTQQILTDSLQLPLQHLNPVPMPTNYVLGGLPFQNSSGWLESLARFNSIFVTVMSPVLCVAWMQITRVLHLDVEV